MARILLRMNGPQDQRVARLKESLNSKLFPSPNLEINTSFDLDCFNAVKDFQVYNSLVDNGMVDQTTWNLLMESETYQPIDHLIFLEPQRSISECWVACTAMVSGKDYEGVINDTPESLYMPGSSGGLYSDNLLQHSADYSYAHQMEYRVFDNGSILPQELRQIMRYGPVMVEISSARMWREREGNDNHWVVIKSIRGDDDISGDGTTLVIFDPFPVNMGEETIVIFSDWVGQNRLHRAFWKRNN